MDRSKLNLDPLKKALTSLERSIVQPKNEFTRDSVIQRFEYTFELSWRLMPQWIEADRALDDNSVKGILREGAKLGLIDNLELWFELQRTRNLTSHTYNENVAEEVYKIALKLPSETKSLLTKLEGKS